MLVFAQFVLSLAALSIATYTDLRERIISDKLTYSIIAIGLLLQALRSLIERNPSIFVVALIVTVATFAASYFLWKLGLWAGGDVKLMTGLAALNPFNLFAIGTFFNLNFELLKPIDLPVFPLTLFIFSIFALLPYGSMLSLEKLLKKPDLAKKTFLDFRNGFYGIILGSASIAGIGAVAKFLNLSATAVFFLLIALFVFGKIATAKIKLEKAPNALKYFKLIASVSLFAFALHENFISAMAGFTVTFLLFAFVFLILKLFFLSKQLLKSSVKISELEEGMIPVESIYLVGGEVKKMPQIEMKTIIKYLKDNKLTELMEYLNPNGKEIVSAKKARGLTVEEIGELQKLLAGKKIADCIEIKTSAPFVPAVLIAYILLNLVGDILWHLV